MTALPLPVPTELRIGGELTTAPSGGNRIIAIRQPSGSLCW
ncbi:MAG TPA: hypothetical protein VK923_04850 [Euzebyales bacterium]|nr:hypothetical protein [Euzebyales bacterium]